MPTVSMILLLSWNAIFITENGLAVVAEDECSTKADCHAPEDLVCCKGDSRNSEKACTPRNCVGHFCFTDGDCARSECCIDSKCTNSSRCRRCDHCVSGEYCCKRGNYPNVCRRSCVGEKCVENTDCGGPDEHCDSGGKCENQDRSSLSRWTIAVIVIGVLLPLIAVCILLWYCCKKRRHRHRTNRAPMVTTTCPRQQPKCCPYDPTRQLPQSPVNQRLQPEGLMPLPYYQRPATISRIPTRREQTNAFYILPQNVHSNTETEWPTARVFHGDVIGQTHIHALSLKVHNPPQRPPPPIQSYTPTLPSSEADSEFADDVYINHLNISPEAYRSTGPQSSP